MHLCHTSNNILWNIIPPCHLSYYFCIEETPEHVSSTGSKVNTSYRWIAYFAGTQFWTRAPVSQGNSATRCYANSKVTRPRPTCLKWIGTNWMISHTQHNSEPTQSRNDSPLGCLHLALAFRYNYCMEESWEHVFGHWQLGKYQLWVKCFMCWIPV